MSLLAFKEFFKHSPALNGLYQSTRSLAIKIGYRPPPYSDKFTCAIDDVPLAERTQTDLHRAFYENSGTLVHKWRHYPEVYDRHLSHFRDKPCRILEIGVSKGGSLQMWRRYFGKDAIVFGIDLDPSCERFNGLHGQVRIGSQDDPAFLKRVVSEMGGIDIVIDDGCHIASLQRVTFNVLFPLIDPNGFYFCEDVHTSYWPDQFDGGYRRRGTMVEMAKDLLDDMHADFHRHGHLAINASRSIFAMHLYTTLLVLEKRPVTKPTSIQVQGAPNEDAHFG